MADLWKIFRKEAAKTTPRRINIQDLTPEERAEIEERAELGAASRDIADSLGLDVNVIYNYKKSLKERAAAQASKPVDTTKEILANKVTQREILKEDFELAKLKLELERSTQQMQMDQIRFLQEIKNAKAEILDTAEDAAGADADIPWSELFSFLKDAFKGGNRGAGGAFQPAQDSIYTEQAYTFPTKNTKSPLINNPQASVKENIPSVIEDSQVTADTDAEEYIEMSDEEIKKIIGSQDKKHIKMAKLLPDKLLFDKIADQFPTLSDQSIDRAIQILRTEY